MTALDRVNAARAELAAAEAALLGDRAPAVAALATLLRASFNSDELRRCLRYHFPSIIEALPHPLASHGAVVDAAVRGLLLADASVPALREWLVAERPRRASEIAAVLALWGAP